MTDDLPYVDEHEIRIPASRDHVWSTLRRYVDPSLGIGARNPLTWILGTEPRAGFEIEREVPGQQLEHGRTPPLLPLSAGVRALGRRRRRDPPQRPDVRRVPGSPRPGLPRPRHRHQSTCRRHEPDLEVDPARVARLRTATRTTPVVTGRHRRPDRFRSVTQRPKFLLEIVVFCVGLSTLGAEIAAARLLAPWFGASTIVWANTIATVLVALSIGYAIGGRLADRNPTMSGLASLVVVAAVLLAIVPFVSGPFLGQSVTAFEELSGGLFIGSLVGVGVLIALPLLLLGMVSPYAVRLKLEQVGNAGKVAGRLSAISTIGALVGTFSAALLLIPLIGTQRSFLLVRPDPRACGDTDSWETVADPSRRGRRHRRPHVHPGGSDEDGHHQRRGHLGEGNRVPVRPRDRGPRRRTRARAQRGPGSALDLPRGRVPHGWLLGLDVRAVLRRRAPTRERREPRQRGRHRGPRPRPLLPRHRGRRGGDRPGRDRGRSRALRLPRQEHHDAQR